MRGSEPQFVCPFNLGCVAAILTLVAVQICVQCFFLIQVSIDSADSSC